MASLSRQLAQWVVGLRYDDLPPDVVDRAKGVTLHGLASVLLGSLTPSGQQAVRLITEEEAEVKNGATIMVDGARVTKGGAAFANAEMAVKPARATAPPARAADLPAARARGPGDPPRPGTPAR